MKRFLSLLALGVLFWGSSAFAADHTAVSCSQTDVNLALAKAQLDTASLPHVIVPAGNCPETNIGLSKAIFLEGAGPGLTVIAAMNLTDTASRVSGFTVTNVAGAADSGLIFAEGQGWRVDHVK